MPRFAAPLSRLSPAATPWLLGSIAALAVLSTLGDPGVTTDEPLDVRPGRTYVQRLLARKSAFFNPDEVAAVFRDNAEHPPLGRWLLGIASTCGQPFETLVYGRDPLDLYLLSARIAPALAFAVLVGLVVHTALRRYGKPSGISAGLALLLMPRVFGHAHLGALDTFIGLFWTAAMLAADRALTSNRPILAMSAAGIVWSLALLTKIHAWFLIPIVFVWTFVRLGKSRPLRPASAFLAWASTGFFGFFLGWPWLWYDSWARLQAYLGTGVVRSTIQTLYLGRVYADRDVPWHYPWVYFAITVPIGLHGLGWIGVVHSWKVRRIDPFPWLLLGSIATFLGTFSTRIPVYDGERLFLLVFPLWAILVGRGFGWLWERSSKRAALQSALIGFLACQGYGVWTFHPFELSYFNALVGGLPGAERLGMELTFWNDAVDPRLLRALAAVLPEGAEVALVPTLYPGQGPLTTNRALVARNTVIGDQERASDVDWLVLSRRSAYWPAGLRQRLTSAQVVAERRRQGVWLSRIVRFDHPASLPNPSPPPTSRNVQPSP